MAKETVPARIYWGLAKVFDRKRHKQHKRELLLEALADFGTREDAFSFGRPEGRPTFKHSGNAGDLIYALPMIKELAGSQGASLRLALNVPISNKHLRHPLGNVMLNQGSFDLLAGLLAAQDYLQEVRVHEGEAVDFDLDVIRRAPLPHDRLGISHWYGYFLGLAPDLSRPWLSVEPDVSTRDTVLLARSGRYRNTHLDFRFLDSVPDLAFVGLPEEYEDMRRQLPNLRWLPVADFHELARLIAGCRLFIGNQSFPFSLAEGLKVPRVLELYPLSPNVIPMGGQALGILFQRQFEHVVASLLA